MREPSPTLEEAPPTPVAARRTALVVSGRAGVIACRSHPQKLAAWRCDRCRSYRCDECVQRKVSEDLTLAACPCGGRCVAHVPPAIVDREVIQEDLVASFTWPLRGSSKYFLGSCGLLHLLACSSLSVETTGGASRLLFLFCSLLFCCSFFLSVIRQSALDPRAELEFPAFTDFWDSVVVPTFRCSAAVGIYLVVPARAAQMVPGLWVVGLAIGAVFLPMALLALAVRDELGGLSPRLVVRSVRRVPASAYATLVAAFFATFALRAPIGVAIRLLGPVGSLIGFPISLYLVCVQLRMLGIFYRRHEGRLRWF